MLRIVITGLSLMMIVAGLGCAALSSLVTPAEVDKSALRYALDAGIADQNDYNAWYPNLDEATRLKRDVDAAHVLNQQELQHLIEKDVTQHGIHRRVTTSNFVAAQQREESIFGEGGLLPIGLSILGASGAAGLLGLARKRPGDISKVEMEQAVASATGKTSAELSIRERQMIEVVGGVQKFIDTYQVTSDETESIFVKELKRCLATAQSTDTRKVVAVMKIV